MENVQIPFTEPEMFPIFERFKQQFAANTPTTDIASDVKAYVWLVMIHAFHPTVKPRQIRSHYIKSFHPDTGAFVLTISEKTQVMALHDRIFKGE